MMDAKRIFVETLHYYNSFSARHHATVVLKKLQADWPGDFYSNFFSECNAARSSWKSFGVS